MPGYSIRRKWRRWVTQDSFRLGGHSLRSHKPRSLTGAGLFNSGIYSGALWTTMIPAAGWVIFLRRV